VIEQLWIDGLFASIRSSADRRDPPLPREPADSEPSPESLRLTALVDLARDGDVDAFGELYDHYNQAIYRYVYYRVASRQIAEDLTSETFFKALRGIGSFHWQGKDFGAWLTTIARNLVLDNAKLARNRLESPSAILETQTAPVAGPEDEVLAGLTNEILAATLRELPEDQRECLVLRFLQSMSISETAQVMNKTEGAVKQLQLRAVRGLARLLPQDLR
jgi:RNA polymerase sigma-70 factor, ECF subfamily